MKWFLATTVTLLSFASAACAQEPADKPVERRRPPAGAPARPAVLMERLSKELNLDADQQRQYQEIVSKYRQRLTDQSSQTQDAEMAQQLREARDSNDEAKARELQSRVRARRGNRDVIQSFLDEVETILHDDQKEKLGQARDRLMTAARGNGLRREGPGGGPGPLARIRELRSALNLTSEQQSQFDKLAGALRGKVDPEGQTPIRDLMEEMRDAVTSGDQDKAADLRSKLGERRKGVESALREFNEHLQPLLSDEQKATLADFRERLGRGPGDGGPGDRLALGRPRDERPDGPEGGGPGANGGPTRIDPRMLLRAAKRLDLSEDQKTQLDSLENGLREKLRDARKDREQMKQLRQETEHDVRAMLTPTQLEQFERILERQSRGAGAKRSSGGTGGDAQTGSNQAERNIRRNNRSGEKSSTEKPKP